MRLAFRIVAGVFAYGDHASALDAPWAWLALAWAVAYVTAAELAGRRARVEVPA